MLDLTVFNLPRELVALSGYRPKVILNAHFEGVTTYLTLSVEFYKDPHFDSYAVPQIDIDFTVTDTGEPEGVSIVNEGARFSSILSAQNQKDLLGVYLRVKQYFYILGIDERKV
jgi:hypothetical protein